MARREIVFGGIQLDCEYSVEDGDVLLDAVFVCEQDISELIEPGSNRWIEINEALEESLKDECRQRVEDRAPTYSERLRWGMPA